MPPLVVEALDLPPDPLGLARRLADRPGLCLLWSADGSGPSFVASDPVERGAGLDPEPALAIGGNDDPRARAPRWIGVLPYEYRRSLERDGRTRRPDPRESPHVVEPAWLRFAAVARVDRDGVRAVGESRDAVRELAARFRAGPAASAAALDVALEPPEDDAEHARRIRVALEHIRAGDLYQVNLARRSCLRVAGHPLDVLAALSRRAPAPYAALIRLGDVDVASTSPELFLALRAGRQLLTAPIKGTRPRGATPAEDARLAVELDEDPKERAELAMILDVERNDLGRVAVTGSVQLVEAPRVVTHATIHHRVATLEARLRAGVGRAALLEAMLPSGSVTGAPKIRAMELIAGLEPVRRGLYTGAFGFVGHDGGLELGMAIRTLTLRDGRAHYHAGGGIVADSDPGREVEETHWKALQLAALLGDG